ncbi:MAG: bifunctional DNA primase/polymerase [Deltaproteobacteria bacterium]|nr:MAG: bifunctional DNA primase/polymerase [Deltaproteobacteria bacterium]
MAKADCEKAALAYLARGWSVVPVESGGKRPIVRWETFQRRRPSEEELRGWFGRRREVSPGIVTGAVSGLVVVDVDPRHGGTESLARLEARHEPLPPSVEARTGGGGRHLYFAHPGGEVRNRVGFAPGLDLRGDGGLVVAPPALHASGARYRWARGRAPDEIPLAPLPGWLLDAVRGENPGAGNPLPGWRARVRAAVPEGERNDTLASLTGHLLGHGVDPELAGELLLCWNRVHCRPPLSDAEVLRTVESITRTHARHHGAS